ncbi:MULTISPECIES: UPF0323 family lipoprotein [unclassified Campylobacter]|uniref:UPF0323 family lipoprotein n=1 Tax=unclassified Campylobacter TaxID=2593542 RepID=UPI001237FB3A|nr:MULTISPECIES: UPF0323 family lipoprotein [unclassified Campylobacter]KAA6227501.1 hypothetical protein FMM55_02895 [Campylobacter sp. LR196d]KAA6228147.1 hypothetical protein FMM54_01225 [Campylobacter sp. LR185c]KAA6228527.1 hypothetical protein FMM57_02900 [Campylobacter sp. LR286c]KAA6230918.1 hypothetical protein FMM58_04315 [Campylobacter sp. LR291e]KAA6233552.1 hypothetical protein FMM56_03320 [Campylobacter sp. LR264d]
MNKHIKKIIQISMLGGIAAISGGVLTACSTEENVQQAQQGAFVIIEEIAPNQYKIKDQFPSDETRVVLKQLDGSERVLSKQEMDALIKEEAARIDNNTSALISDNAQLSSGGLSLGETLLASAAGAILGSWIGSKLFNNQNFANQQRGAFSNQSAYQRSVNSFNNAGAKSSTKSGFFGGGSKSSSSSSFGS